MTDNLQSTQYERIITELGGTVDDLPDRLESTYLRRIAELCDAAVDPNKMPTIRLAGTRKLRTFKKYLDSVDESGDQCSDEFTEEYPLVFSVEIVSGTLQVGDELQLCMRKMFCSTAKDIPPYYKLKRFFKYVITEDDLDKKFIQLKFFGKNKMLLRSASSTHQYPKYIRIRRPILGELGEPVNSLFSNEIPFTVYRSKTNGISIR